MKKGQKIDEYYSFVSLKPKTKNKNKNKNKTENSVFKKYNPKMTNCTADLSFRLYLKKESCLYDINIKRTFSDHNLSDANSLVALPHSETSCRLLFIHVSITDWWFSWYISSSPVYHWSRRHAYYLYTEIWREKKGIILGHVTRNWLSWWMTQITSRFGNLAVKADRI